jgi:lysophospholipid hydrolase
LSCFGLLIEFRISKKRSALAIPCFFESSNKEATVEHHQDLLKCQEVAVFDQLGIQIMISLDYLRSICTSPILWSTVTLFNTVLCILAVGFWTTNRQTQIKKSKSQQKPSKQIVNDYERSENENEDEQELYFNDWTRYDERRNLVHNMKTSDIGIDTLEASDDEDEIEGDVEVAAESSELKVVNQKVQPGSAERKIRSDLFKSISKLKIFSYLSDDAFLLCLSLMEYVDLPEEGMELFTEDKPFDGSLYIVIDGKVDLSCSLSSCEEKPIFLSAGPGDILTSLLSTLCGLIEEFQREKGCSTTRVSMRIHEVDVQAKAVEDKTRLIRIPPSALVTLLQLYPQDIHQIAQTIIARCQRVTIQTLVKNLGLGFEILYSHGRSTMPINSDVIGELRSVSGQEKGEIEELVEEIYKDFTEEAVDSTCVIGVNEEIMERLSRLVSSSLGSTDRGVVDALVKESSIIMVKAGDVILPAESKSEYLYFVIDGAIEVGIEKKPEYGIKSASYNNPKDGVKDDRFRTLYNVFQGDFVGAMSCFTDEASFVTLRSASEGSKSALVFRLPKKTFQSLVDKYSSILIRCVNKILTVDFSPLVHLFDWSMEWMHIQAGTLLVKKNERCSKMHVVLSGRLKAGPKSLGRHKDDEYGRGACIGETYVLLGEEYPIDVFAIRNSELAVISENVLEFIMHLFPQTAVHFAKQIATRQDQRKRGKYTATRGFTASPENDMSVATLAVVPLCFESSHDAHALSETISGALKKMASTTLMTKSVARKSVGSKVFNLRNAVHELKMSRLLGDLEESHKLTVYQTDAKFTWWTKLCIQVMI